MEVLNLEEACKLLRVAKPTLYRYIRSGNLPAFKMGRVWRFHKESLDNWIRAKVQQDTSERSQNGTSK